MKFIVGGRPGKARLSKVRYQLRSICLDPSVEFTESTESSVPEVIPCFPYSLTSFAFSEAAMRCPSRRSVLSPSFRG